MNECRYTLSTDTGEIVDLELWRALLRYGEAIAKGARWASVIDQKTGEVIDRFERKVETDGR